MTSAIKIALSSVAITLATFAVLPQSAQAWKTEQSGGAICSEQNTVVLEWSFTNTEPNKPKWAMDVVAKDNNSGIESAKVTVNPGETKSGTIDTGLDTVGKGTITLKLTWTDGRQGVDTRTVQYDATNCRVVEVCRDGEIVTINETTVRNTDGDIEECAPEETKVCRDGEIITISVDDVRDTDGDVAACEEEETTKVCRDGEIVEILVSEVKDTDGDVDNCDEEEVPQTLPNTGPAAIAGLFGTGIIGLSAHSFATSRAALRRKLLKR